MKFVHAQTKCRVKIGAVAVPLDALSERRTMTMHPEPEITFRQGGKEMSVLKPYVRDPCLTGVARSLLINCEVV